MVDDDVCIAAAILHSSSGARRPATGRRADGLMAHGAVRLPAVCRGLPALPQASCQWCKARVSGVQTYPGLSQPDIDS